MEFVGDSGESLDPRIKIELENLNTATEDINKLESALDDANAAFKQVLSESSQQLSELANKIGQSCIDKSRQYYEVLEEARRAQVQCQYQAQLFQRASEIHAAAKETAALAEARFMAHKHEWNFDQAWQDMLNHATTKVMHAANQKEECGREHQRKALLFHNAERQVQQLEGKHHRAIIKARPYFDLRAMYEQKLATQKQQVECLQKAVQEAKRTYSRSFRALEEISNQIHEQRREYVNGPREPGVGAELMSPHNSLSDETITNENQDVLEPQYKTDNINSRLIDGSETPLSQWEIELQTSMKNVENLSLGNLTNESKALSTSLATLTACRKSLDDIDKELKEISTECQKSHIDIVNERISKNPSRSLPRSPVNTTFHKSKLMKSHLSKSLSNISKSAERHEKSVEVIENDKIEKDTQVVHREDSSLSSPSSSGNDDDNSDLSVGHFITDAENNSCDHDCAKQRLTNTDVFHSSDFSLDSNESHRSEPNTLNSIDKMKNIYSDESPESITKTKEFPIFSMLDQLSSTNDSSGKLSLKTTWTDKSNLNTALNDPKSRSIPATSAEKLANARSALLRTQASDGD